MKDIDRRILATDYINWQQNLTSGDIAGNTIFTFTARANPKFGISGII